MIIPKENVLTPEEEAELRSITAEFGIDLQPISGAHRTIYAMLGDERDELLINRIEGLEYIDKVDTIQVPFKLMAKGSELAHHRIRVGGKTLGEEFLIIAGQCTIDPDNPNFFYETAQAVKEAGGDVLRGGVWKPRTSPHSYQGHAKAMDILIEARSRTGLPVDTEVMDEEQLDIALEAGVDMLQVGARNALNYGLLKQIGRKIRDRKTIVLLKRGMHMGSLDEFILAGEYIAAGGNPNVVLCPRGTVPAMDGYRNHPDESITPLLKEKTWAPVVVDPSHAVGKAAYVPFAAVAAAAYGADGICVETHVSPTRGIGDDPKQAITPEVLQRVVRDVHAVHRSQKKHLEHLHLARG